MTTKGCKKRVSSLEGLLGAILASAAPPMGVRALGIGDSGLEVHSLSMREYAPSVREIFGRGELEELISEARRQVWPHLNQQPLRLGSPREFREAWSPLGIEFRMAKLRSPRGMALLGFYVGKSPVSKRPLICVNTAHHRAAMSAAFAHEMEIKLAEKVGEGVGIESFDRFAVAGAVANAVRGGRWRALLRIGKRGFKEAFCAQPAG